MAGSDVRYDYNTCRHYHVHCRRCGRVADVLMPADFPVRESVKDSCGFSIENFQIEFLGALPRLSAVCGSRYARLLKVYL